jgi:hypothetical protein
VLSEVIFFIAAAAVILWAIAVFDLAHYGHRYSRSQTLVLGGALVFAPAIGALVWLATRVADRRRGRPGSGL